MHTTAWWKSKSKTNKLEQTAQQMWRARIMSIFLVDSLQNRVFDFSLGINPKRSIHCDLKLHFCVCVCGQNVKSHRKSLKITSVCVCVWRGWAFASHIAAVVGLIYTRVLCVLFVRGASLLGGNPPGLRAGASVLFGKPPLDFLSPFFFSSPSSDVKHSLSNRKVSFPGSEIFRELRRSIIKTNGSA